MIKLLEPGYDFEQCEICQDDCVVKVSFEDSDENSKTVKLCSACGYELYDKLKAVQGDIF